MDTDPLDGSKGLLPPSRERTLPDDAAEYMLFVVDDGPATTLATSSGSAASRLRARLDQVRKAALQLCEDLTKDYIWQRDSFHLETVSRNGLVYLRGVTSYGDCVEDEWLIVYMLRELSRQFPDVWVRIGDSDGEFLLVEAAKAVPRWLNPEMDAHRVWIHDGTLVVIPLETEAAGGQPSSLALAEAVRVLRTAPDSLVHMPALEKEAFHRLRKYPGHVASSIYHTRLVLPRKIAYVLHDRPRAVAPAVEAFVARDPISTKTVLGTHTPQFPPTDLVAVSVTFTRVLYAQLRGLRFTPPTGWSAAFDAFCQDRLPPEAADLEKRQAMLDISMKLACGFELMASAADTSNSRVVREVGLVLQDVADDASMLPSDQEIREWDGVDREDDDAWLHIDLDEFERELDSGRNEAATGRSAAPTQPVSDAGAGFGDAGVQTDLRRIVSRFQEFLDDNDAGVEGAEFDEMDDDDDESDSDEDGDNVDFDEDEFNRLMREMMGMPPAKGAESSAAVATASTASAASIAPNSTKPIPASDEDDVEGILNLAAQFEAELKGHGALKLNPPKSKGKDGTSKEMIDGSKESAAVSPPLDKDLDSDDDDDDDEVDVDFNLAKNLLESFKGQEGMAGPAGNILGMLGMTLPRDKDDDDDEER